MLDPPRRPRDEFVTIVVVGAVLGGEEGTSARLGLGPRLSSSRRMAGRSELTIVGLVIAVVAAAVALLRRRLE